MFFFYMFFPEPSGNIFLPDIFRSLGKGYDADLWPFFSDVFHGCQVSRSGSAWIQIFCRHVASHIKASGQKLHVSVYAWDYVVCLLLLFVVHVYRNGLCKGIPHPQETSIAMHLHNSPTSSNWGIIWLWQPAGLIIASVVLPAYFAYKILIFLVKQV